MAHITAKALNFYRYQRGFQCRGTRLVHQPLELFFEVANCCNLNCMMCATHGGNQPYAGSIMTRYLLDQSLPFADTALTAHYYGFGEPLMNPELLSFIPLFKTRGVLADFFTNGVLLTKEKISALVDMGLDQMTVSFSGATRQTYEIVHRRATFDRTVQNLMEIKTLKRAKRRHRPLISFNFIAMNMNFHELPLLMRLAGKLDVFRVYVKPLVVYTDKPFLSSEKRVYNPQRDDPILDLARKIGRLNGIQLRDDDYRTAVPPSAGFGAKIHPAESSNKHFPMPKCHEPWRTFFIGVSGEVKPCCFYGGSAPMGNLSISSAVEIWNGKTFQLLREQIRSGITPSGCEHCVEFGLMPRVQSALREAAAYGVKWLLPVTTGSSFRFYG